MRPLGLQRIQLPLCAPAQEHPQIRLGVLTGQAFEPGQIGRHGQPKHIGLFRHHAARTDGRHHATAHDPVSVTGNPA